MYLWQYNKITGYWVQVRTVTSETKNEWLKVYQDDEPNESFKVSINRPIAPPKDNEK
jgi:hypothetical protein